MMSLQPSATSSAIRIIVVEDSAAVRDVLVEQLNEIPNVQVVGTADSESSALEVIAATPYDILIVDIQLRVGTGLGVLRTLTLRPPEAGAPPTKIVFSNFTEGEFQRLAQRYDAQYFFDKSRGFSSLIHTVERLAANA